MKQFSLILIPFLFIGCAAVPLTKNIQIKPEEHNQVIIVDPVNKTQAQLTLWQYEHRQWKKMYGPIPAVVGRSGIAKQGIKKEGDGFTPSGTFDLPYAFGKTNAINSAFPYHQATTHDFWVDDVKSPQYNQWVKGKPDASSFEELNRKDRLYHLAVVVNYNTNPIKPGDGSAIFLHIWRNYYHPTSGCIAINERHLRKIVKRLNKNLKPVIQINANQ